jgi:hypothetical protein
MAIQIQKRDNITTPFDATTLHGEVRAVGLKNSDAAKVVAKTEYWMDMAKRETPTGPVVDYRDLNAHVARQISKVDPIAGDKYKQKQVD